MAIKAVLTGEEFAAAGEAIQSLYEKDADGAYVLALDGVDSHPAVVGLKSNHDKLLTEKKTAEKAKKEAEQAAAEKAAADAVQKGEFEQLYKSAKAALDAKNAEVEEIKGRVASEKLNSEAVRLAGQLASDAWRQELLVEQIQKRLAMTEDGIKIKDATGNLSVMTTKQLAEEIKTKYPGLVDGSKASGGGAAKQHDGGAGKEVITRAEFEAKSPMDKAKFARSGGKIEN